MAGSAHKVDFGSLSPFTEPWKSKCKFFPSKVGGVPSFLVLNPILGPDQVCCKVCQRTMRFVMQIYAPIDDVSDAFHRTLYLFACGYTDQCINQFVIFRSQLPRQNKFYSDEPPDYERDESTYDPNPVQFGSKVCSVCGLLAPNLCSSCRKESYCSREHQILHWKEGNHKQKCDNYVVDKSDAKPIYKSVIFAEFELLIGDEDEDEETSQNDTSLTEMQKYQKFLSDNQPALQNEDLHLFTNEEGDEEQRAFEKFKKSIRSDYVIRYQVDWRSNEKPFEEILYVSSKNCPTEQDIPNCENCGAVRRFEFQVLPQLLNKIIWPCRSIMDHLDWGTLMVFCCERSCTVSKPDVSNVFHYYLPEVVYNQKIY